VVYRNGTYIAFHANGTNRPGESDIDYYNLMKAWSAKSDDDFAIINSHEKVAAVRDSSRKETLRASLLARLKESKNMVLIVGETTRLDYDWVPFEIEKANDVYGLPIIVAYTNYKSILAPTQLRQLWPQALASRIDALRARVVHIPFKKAPLADAIARFDQKNLPEGALTHYTQETYKKWGLL
jgi:hypothetical protein